MAQGGHLTGVGCQCARYGFAQVSPLLADVAAVDEGGLVRLTATPARMELPSECLTVRVEPLQ